MEGASDVDAEALTARIIGCAIEVHRALGPGLLERTSQEALSIELAPAAIHFEH